MNVPYPYDDRELYHYCQDVFCMSTRDRAFVHCFLFTLVQLDIARPVNLIRERCFHKMACRHINEEQGWQI